MSGAAAQAVRQTKTTISSSTGTASRVDVAPRASGIKTFVMPHVLETSGRIDTTPHTFDATFHMIYTGGITGGTAQSATVDLYLFDNSSGGALQNGANNVCMPCSVSLGGTERKKSLVIDTLISAVGPATFGTKAGFGIIVVGGADPNNVSIQGFVTASHATPLDLSVFGFEPGTISE